MASEEYHEYLCSREWGLKREAVVKRSGGICERCRRWPGEAVHHKTYIRVYRERLEDLIHLCGQCHDWMHGRSNVDPCMMVVKPVLKKDAIAKSVMILQESVIEKEVAVLVNWFYEQEFATSATAPYAEGACLVDCFSTEEVLENHPDYEKFSNEVVEAAVYEIDGDDRDSTDSTGWWWDAKGWHD